MVVKSVRAENKMGDWCDIRFDCNKHSSWAHVRVGLVPHFKQRRAVNSISTYSVVWTEVPSSYGPSYSFFHLLRPLFDSHGKFQKWQFSINAKEVTSRNILPNIEWFRALDLSPLRVRVLPGLLLLFVCGWPERTDVCRPSRLVRWWMSDTRFGGPINLYQKHKRNAH